MTTHSEFKSVILPRIEKLGLWSCDPEDIKPWSKEEAEMLGNVLDEIFSVNVETPVDLPIETQ